MKVKRETDSATLGTYIRMERKRVGLTQAQLGKLIGLKESRVSKIENGAPITPEVASFILSKMGSELQLKVVSTNGRDKATNGFLMSVIYHYSKLKNLPLDRAFRYLKTFKGLEYLVKYKDIEQTLAYEDIVSNLSKVCANNGGAL
ncbi:MAG: DUF3791 domain-containing protein [Muribaculaceae bacterium]|nr:DUF3791 domain-containing protein [Muribaculaceae bacterium]